MVSLERSLISAGEAHAFVLETDALDASALDRAWSVLDETEKTRALNLHSPQDRAAFVGAHALVRTTLGRYTRLDPKALRFKRSDLGRPELDLKHLSQDLRFSLSHSAGLVGCAISVGADIGFDLEFASRPAPLEVAERYFADSEKAWLAGLPPDTQHDQFYALWTIKEAYAKALGLGLHLDPSSFSIDFSPEGQPQLGRAPPGAAEAGRWTLRSWRRGLHWAGLALSGATRTVLIRSAEL